MLGLPLNYFNGRILKNPEDAMADIFFYIESFYNRRRRHSTLGYLSPLAYEAHYQQQMIIV